MPITDLFFRKNNSLNSPQVRVVVPSLRISGGVFESINLAKDILHFFPLVKILSLWKSDRPIENETIPVDYLTYFRPNLFRAFFQIFIMACLFMSYLYRQRKKHTVWIFTHYSTSFISLLVPRSRRWFFVQDIEWRFIGNIYVSNLIKLLLIFIYRRSNIISANQYLHDELLRHGVKSVGCTHIWADSDFYQNLNENLDRKYDVLMILRKGDHKRLDLYMSAIKYFKLNYPDVIMAAITTDDLIYHDISNVLEYCYLRPTRDSIKDLYRDSKIFLLLSEHEGFGLPPLEAMGSGCVPVCRDSGGPRVYMTNDLSSCLLGINTPVNQICDFVISLLIDSNKISELSLVSQCLFYNGLQVLSNKRQNLRDYFGNVKI